MFGVSIPEILLVCVVILIVLGPDRLPGATRKVAQMLGQFRRQADLIRRELYNSMYEPAEDMKRDFQEIQNNLRAVKDEFGNIVPSIPEELMTCEDKERFADLKKRALNEEEAPQHVQDSSEKSSSEEEPHG